MQARNLNTIRQVFEEHGIEFLGLDGVRLLAQPPELLPRAAISGEAADESAEPNLGQLLMLWTRLAYSITSLLTTSARAYPEPKPKDHDGDNKQHQNFNQINAPSSAQPDGNICYTKRKPYNGYYAGQPVNIFSKTVRHKRSCALRTKQNLTQQLCTFENPIGVGTTVIRMKDCWIRNEMRQLLHYPVQHPADAVQEHGTVTGGRMVFRGLATNPLNRLSPKPALTRISAAH